MLRNRAVSLALAGLFAWLDGCASYEQIEIGELTEHGRVRVTLAGGERETLLDPAFAGDSISGRKDAPRRHRDPIVPVVIPLDQVDKLEAVNRNAGGTAALIVVGVIGGFVLIGGIAVAAGGGY
jgi:hypothetical protein